MSADATRIRLTPALTRKPKASTNKGKTAQQ